LQRRLQSSRAFLQSFALFVRQIGNKHRFDAACTEDTGQRQGDPERLLKASDRDNRALVVQDHFGDTRRHDADSILARIVPLDDRDVGVPYLLLDFATQVAQLFAAGLQQRVRGHASDSRRGPQEHL
jgi:hypothetical protein